MNVKSLKGYPSPPTPHPHTHTSYTCKTIALHTYQALDPADRLYKTLEKHNLPLRMALDRTEAAGGLVLLAS